MRRLNTVSYRESIVVAGSHGPHGHNMKRVQHVMPTIGLHSWPQWFCYGRQFACGQIFKTHNLLKGFLHACSMTVAVVLASVNGL